MCQFRRVRVTPVLPLRTSKTALGGPSRESCRVKEMKRPSAESGRLDVLGIRYVTFF